MGMTIDKTRHHGRLAQIDDLGVGQRYFSAAHFTYSSALDDHRHVGLDSIADAVEQSSGVNDFAALVLHGSSYNLNECAGKNISQLLGNFSFCSRLTS